jgi:NAD(P)H-flavin reductase
VIIWWERKPDSIVFLVQPHNGFTKRVKRLTTGPWRAVIEGPYGTELDFGSYGTILMFATGFGIAGQLPYIKALFEGCKRGEVVTRRIALFWQINVGEEVLLECVKDWMDDLLRRDTEYV